MDEMLLTFKLSSQFSSKATLGLSLTVPFGMISDAVLRKKHFNLQYILGSLLVTWLNQTMALPDNSPVNKSHPKGYICISSCNFAKRKMVNLCKFWPDWLAIGFLNHLKDVYIIEISLGTRRKHTL